MKNSFFKIMTYLSLFCLSSVLHANAFDNAIKNGTTSGQARFGYIAVDPEVAGKTTTGAAIGGILKFESAKLNNHQFAIAPYFVEQLAFLNGDASKNELNGDFFDSNNEGFAYIGEVYVNYDFTKTSVRVGRQKLDNPFINTDEIRMFSNTFDGIWINSNMGDALKLEAGHIGRWAGFDSGGSQEKFKNTSNDGGVTAVGINYKQSNSLSTQAWIYNFDKSYSLIYADVTYTKGGVEIGAQIGNYSEANSSGTEGTVIGLAITYAIDSFTFNAVMNSGENANNKSASLGLGGGNYYAAMDESTISGLNDAQAHVVSVEYAASNQFVASVALGHFEDSTKATKIDETNLVVSYNASKNLNVEFIHAVIDNKGTPTDAGTNFSRQTLRTTYSF